MYYEICCFTDSSDRIGINIVKKKNEAGFRENFFISLLVKLISWDTKLTTTYLPTGVKYHDHITVIMLPICVKLAFSITDELFHEYLT